MIAICYFHLIDGTIFIKLSTWSSIYDLASFDRRVPFQDDENGTVSVLNHPFANALAKFVNQCCTGP